MNPFMPGTRKRRIWSLGHWHGSSDAAYNDTSCKDQEERKIYQAGYNAGKNEKETANNGTS